MKDYKEAKEMVFSGKNLKETAEALNISYETLRRIAAKEKWLSHINVDKLIEAEKAAIARALKEVETVPIEKRGELLAYLAQAINEVINAEVLK